MEIAPKGCYEIIGSGAGIPQPARTDDFSSSETQPCTEGLPLLQVDEHADYSGLSLELLKTTTLLAFKADNMLSSHELQAKLDTVHSIDAQEQQHTLPMTRHAFACFDAISVPTESVLSTVSGLQQSAFDGPLDPIATDIAPYVRSIIHFDLARAALCLHKLVRASTCRESEENVRPSDQGTF